MESLYLLFSAEKKIVFSSNFSHLVVYIFTITILILTHERILYQFPLLPQKTNAHHLQYFSTS